MSKILLDLLINDLRKMELEFIPDTSTLSENERTKYLCSKELREEIVNRICTLDYRKYIKEGYYMDVEDFHGMIISFYFFDIDGNITYPESSETHIPKLYTIAEELNDFNMTMSMLNRYITEITPEQLLMLNTNYAEEKKQDTDVLCWNKITALPNVEDFQLLGSVLDILRLRANDTPPITVGPKYVPYIIGKKLLEQLDLVDRNGWIPDNIERKNVIPTDEENERYTFRTLYHETFTKRTEKGNIGRIGCYIGGRGDDMSYIYYFLEYNNLYVICGGPSNSEFYCNYYEHWSEDGDIDINLNNPYDFNYLCYEDRNGDEDEDTGRDPEWQPEWQSYGPYEPEISASCNFGNWFTPEEMTLYVLNKLTGPCILDRIKKMANLITLNSKKYLEDMKKGKQNKRETETE